MTQAILTSPQELETWLDEFMAEQMDKLHIPAGNLSATATDMANFAIAHLQHGKFKSQRILSENTARQMQQQQFTLCTECQKGDRSALEIRQEYNLLAFIKNLGFRILFKKKLYQEVM